MMKVKVIESFHDLHGGTLHRRGEVMDVTKTRYKEIQKAGEYVVPVEEKKKEVTND